MPPSAFLNAPPLPKAIGCYHYIQTGWEKVPCSPQPVKKPEAYPTQEPSPILNPPYLLGNTQYGINSQIPVFTYSMLMVNFQKYSGEVDYENQQKWDSSKKYGGGCGSDAYSLQLNTNWFMGPKNGDWDWVQFVYQNSGECSHTYSGLCIWNINTDTQDYDTGTVCVNPPGKVGLSGGYEAIISAYAYQGMLDLDAYLNGGLWGVTAVDEYGLEGQWTQSSGGIMGLGGGDVATFPSGTKLQTDIFVSDCSNSYLEPLFSDCSTSGFDASPAGDKVTAESASLPQYGSILTNYFHGTHWWLSSASAELVGSNPQAPGEGASCASANQPGCGQFVNYGTAFGLGNVMAFTVEDTPNYGAVTAGGTASTSVNVTSVDGVVAGPITMSLEPPGMQQGGGLGTEDLTGRQCTPSTSTSDGAFTYLQPGSNCELPLDMSTSLAATLGMYNLNIKGSPPPNVPDSIAAGETGYPAGGAGVMSVDTAGYQLTIQAAAPPTPVIYRPGDGSSYPVNQPVELVGYATQYIQGQLGAGYVDCSQLVFEVGGQSISTEPDSSYQSTGYCDAVTQPSFSSPQSVVITLGVLNSQNEVVATAEVTITITSPTSPGPSGSGTTPFTFQVTASPSSAAVMIGQSAQFTVTITCLSDCSSPQPVTLSVGGLWKGAQYSWSVNPAIPDLSSQQATVTLTIQAPVGTPQGTYNVVISGITNSYQPPPYTVQLTIETLG